MKKGIEFYSVKTSDIVCIYRTDLVIFVMDKNGTRYLFDESLSELEMKLSKSEFFRVNRRIIVNINYIKSYKTVDKSKLELNLSIETIPFRIFISQELATRFKNWLTGSEV